MRRVTFAILVVFLVVGAGTAQVTAIRAGRVIDPETGKFWPAR